MEQFNSFDHAGSSRSARNSSPLAEDEDEASDLEQWEREKSEWFEEQLRRKQEDFTLYNEFRESCEPIDKKEFGYAFLKVAILGLSFNLAI